MLAEAMTDILQDETAQDTPVSFPDAPQGWHLEDAKQHAAAMGIEMTDAHWDVIRALQHYFARHEFPNRRELSDALEERFYQQGGRKYLYRLFPGGPVAQGTIIAGLAAPAGSVDKSFGSVV